ncbi:MAG TPA: sortase [Candidatus Saccharimonadales bacterium]|nr:sortase [Candidatus Saccharimonadales bacterium]
MKITNIRKHGLKAIAISAVALIAFSLVFIVPTLYFRYSHQGTVSVKSILPHTNSVTKAVPGAPLIAGWPVNIAIPSVDINVGIVNGYYDVKTATWNVGLSVAQYVPLTTPPNNLSGDTYIYGHYRPAVFAYLHHIVPGSKATVTTANGYSFTYKYINTYATAPTDISVLSSYDGPPVLLVQTCSGSFFQNRQFYVFDYLSYQKLSA